MENLAQRVARQYWAQYAHLRLASKMSLTRAYEVLGLRPGASLEEAKRAYKALTLTRHPDAGGSHDAQVQLNAAMAVISDQEGLGSQRVPDDPPVKRDPPKETVVTFQDAWSSAPVPSGVE